MVTTPGTGCSGEWVVPGDGKEGHRHQVWIPAPDGMVAKAIAGELHLERKGGPRGAAPRAKTSTMIMRPPQQGHGGR